MQAINSALFRARDDDKLFLWKLSDQIRQPISFFSNCVIMKNCPIVHLNPAFD